MRKILSKRNAYLVHRWLGLIVGVQLLAWSVGGFTFSILDIENVRGNMDRTEDPAPTVRAERVQLSPAEAIAAAAKQGLDSDTVTRVVLRERFDRTVYELFGAKRRPLGAVDAVSGAFLPRVSEEEARRSALSDFAPEATVASVQLLEGEPPNEFRGRPMPVYQVVLDHPQHPHLYVSPVTGEILARRNRIWRIFDFFWMLHIMDYRQRENFNHWLLTTMSVLAILTSASGLILWWWRMPFRRRRVSNKVSSGS
ncbi:MAG: PepSY domain-containing protein [Planctomycetes bacterium]|nr:PepSY domain-containing protein [Planctomycetota bacterium]